MTESLCAAIKLSKVKVSVYQPLYDETEIGTRSLELVSSDGASQIEMVNLAGTS